MPTFVKVLITIAAVIVGIILLLFIAARVLHFDSIWALLRHMAEGLNVMWERIISW